MQPQIGQVGGPRPRYSPERLDHERIGDGEGHCGPLDPGWGRQTA
ncbi:MAG: hypothetical protein OXG13_17930 [Gemmatimonadaceae bacterium]|nr:hypothetical protein [Gemmatimonadaceae bacterium]